MANTNTPYIAKNAAPLLNPTVATVFTQLPSPIATVQLTQTPRTAYIRYAGYAQIGAGTSNNINIINVAVRASGRMTFGAAGSYTPSIVIAAPGSSVAPLPTATTNATIGTINPLAATAAGQGLWTLSANLLWDPNSGLIAGSASGYEATLVNGAATETLTGATAITPLSGYVIVPPLSTLATTQAQNTAQINNGGELAIFFACTGLFSASNAANVSYLDDFEVEVL